MRYCLEMESAGLNNGEKTCNWGSGGACKNLRNGHLTSALDAVGGEERMQDALTIMTLVCG